MPTALGTIASGYKSGAWSPLNLPNLIGWWDATNAASFTYASGVVVSQWNDLSGAGRHMTQATGGYQPSRNGTINGNAVVTFDADYLTFDAGGDSASLAAPFTVLIVAVTTNDGGYQRVLSGHRSAAGLEDYQAPNLSFSKQAYPAIVAGANGVQSPDAPMTTGVPYLIQGRVKSGTAAIRMNEVTELSSAVNAAFGPLRYLRLGADVNSSATVPPGASGWWYGTIGEVIICQTDLAAGDLTNVRNYLTAKWIPTYTDVLMEPFNNYTFAPWTTAGATSIVAGRHGTAAQIQNSATSISYNIPTINQSDTITIGFAIKWSHGGNSKVMFLRSDSGATEHNQLILESTNALTFSRGSTGLVSSATSVVTPGTWYYLELQAKLADAGGFVIVRLNGTPVINVTSLDTKNGGTKTVYDQVRMEMFDGRVNQYDDLYITMGAGAPFKGDITIP